MKKLLILMTLVVLFCNCKKSISPEAQQSSSAQDDATAKRLQIGDDYAGGIIFYFSDDDHKHGRVCARKDVGAFSWDPTIFDPQNPQNYNPHYVGGTYTSKLYGAANTTGIILALDPGNYAAYMARYWGAKGFNDWSLPSKDELNLIYQRIKLAGLSSFPGTYYWSSSEIDNKAAWCQKFTDGVQLNTAWKNNVMNVRATRGF